MGDKISALPSSSTVASTDVFLKSNAVGSTEIITFDDLQKNFTFLRTTFNFICLNFVLFFMAKLEQILLSCL